MTIKTTRAEGFSIIEVLVAVVIFTVALVALARFMGGLMVAGSEAKARAFASSLAQEKLEDLRQFTYLPTYAEMSTNPNPPDPATFGYADIADDGGGSKEGGSVRIPAGTVASDKVAGSNVTYDLTWSATDYYFQPGDPDAAASTTWNTAWGTKPAYSDFKQVTVTVSWLDPKGIQQFIELAGQVNSVPPSTVARAGSPEDERTSPIVHYTPQEAPDVIAIPIGIGVGGDKKKETLKPIPDVNQAGSVTWVSFGTITFEELAADVFSSLIREDFITLNCPCELDANVTNASVAKKEATPSVSRRVWNGSELIDQVGPELLKTVGSTTLGTNDAAYNLCNTCCREHHDPDATEVDVADRCDPFSVTNPERAFNCYDMNRSSDAYRAVTGGGYAHKHYNAAGNEVTTPNQEYLEACRLKRLDGIWRVFSDWRLAAITAVESQDLEDGGDLQSDYVTRVQNIVNDVVDDFGDVQPSSVTAMPGTTETLFQGQSTQTQSRSVYVDEMAESQLTDENFTDLSDDARLEFVPFYELNTTLLSNWYPNPDAGSYAGDVDAAIARATNEAVDSIIDPLNDYYGSYSRGVVTAQSISPSALASTQVVSDIKRSNTGITSSQPIDPYDAAVTPSTIGVAVVAFPNVGVSGILSTDNVESSNKNVLKGALSISWTGIIDVAGTPAPVGGSCDVSWQGNAGSYDCTMQEGTSAVTINPSASGFVATPSTHFLPGPLTTGATGQDFAFDESGS